MRAIALSILLVGIGISVDLTLARGEAITDAMVVGFGILLFADIICLLIGW